MDKTKLPSVEKLPTIDNSSLFKASIDYLYKQFKIGNTLYNLKQFVNNKENSYFARYLPEAPITMKKSDFVKGNIEVYSSVSNSNPNKLLSICNKNNSGNCKPGETPGSTQSMISRKNRRNSRNNSKLLDLRKKKKIDFFFQL